MDSDAVQRYLSKRHGSNHWATRADVIEAWRKRDFFAVPAHTLEFSPALSCNARCGTCSFAKQQRAHTDGLLPIIEHAPEDDRQAARADTGKRIIEAAKEADVEGIIWTGGGEPTVWEPLLRSLRFSSQLGMVNAIYTNGFRLGYDSEFAEALIEPETGLVFLRFSINAVSPSVVEQHWGIPAQDVAHQLAGLARVLDTRNKMAPAYSSRGLLIPSVQISVIVDRRNVGDLRATCLAVAEIFEQHRSAVGAEDVLVVRPLTIHGRATYSTHDHTDSVITELIAVCGDGGDGRAALGRVGVPVFLGFGLDAVQSGAAASYSEVLEADYASRDTSWSNGLFLIVGPSGDVYPTTERNCDPAWSLGSLMKSSVAEIYGGTRRREIIRQFDSEHWGPRVVQPTPRTARLDRIARAVMSGELGDVDIEEIREHAEQTHPLMLD
jgi:MoaA/NifB/PqqE/SkfB family radical SAM enzyme